MDIEALAENVGKFIGHYAGELGKISDAVGGVLSAVPIDAQDKDRISTLLSELTQAAERAAAGANALLGQDVEVTVAASDVEAAVGEYLAEHPEVIANAEHAGNGNG